MDLRFSPDGAFVVTHLDSRQADRVVFWDAADGIKRKILQLPTPPPRSNPQPTPTFDPAGRRLAIPQGTQVYLYDLDPVRPPTATAADVADPGYRMIRGHASTLRSVAFGRDGSRLVTLAVGGVMKHWDATAHEPRLRTPFRWGQRLGAVLPNADGSRVAFVPARDDPALRFRLTDGAGQLVGEEVVLPPGHGDSMGFSADGRTFALVWHHGNTFTLVVWDAVAGKELWRRTPSPNSFAWVSLSPDGSRVAVTTAPAANEGRWRTSTLDVWETATGSKLLSRSDLRSEDRFRADYSPDGRWLTIHPGLASNGDVRIVWLDARTGTEAATLKLGPRMVTGRTFSRDGRRLALVHRAGETSTLGVWDIEPILRGEAPEPVATMTGLSGDFPRVEFSPDGRRVLTTGDGTAKLWDVASGREVAALKARGMPIGDAVFSPDGCTIWGGLDEDGRLWGWDGTPRAD
jgi:WD40 repeat protein